MPITLPPMPPPSDPQAFNWSKAELRAIKAYAKAAVLADRAAQPVQPALPVAWKWRAFEPDSGEAGHWLAWKYSDCKPSREPDRWFQVCPLYVALAQPALDLIEECRDALAEELAGWDIDPPLHHVKQAHDRCVKWLSLAAIAQPVQPAHDIAGRTRVIEMCAAAIEPKNPRPCDCTSCDCGDSGNTRDVAAWDASTADAAMLRAMKETQPVQPAPQDAQEPVYCPYCPDQGWYGIETGGCGPDGENDTRQMEQVQCEFCYTTPNSVFNVQQAEAAQPVQPVQPSIKGTI